MENVFLHLFNMSITAGWLVLAVVVLRLLLKKAPRWIVCLLWVLVAVRLICPVSIESVLSLIPSGETVPTDTFFYDTPTIDSGVPIVDSVINPVLSETLAPTPENSVNPTRVLTFIASLVWVLGMVAMAVYALVSTLRLRYRVRESVCMERNIRQCDRIATPFILGVLRPRIYLPSTLNGAALVSVVAHEEAHLKRRDHWWKPLGFLLLTIYWFNPLLWVAYILLCRDIEAACDEKVVRDMDTHQRKAYSEALLSCSAPRRLVSACPLAFGETGVKSRIKSVLSYKKPAFWLVLVSVVAVTVAAVCLLTNPKTEMPEDLDSYISQVILEHNKGKESNFDFACEAHTVFGTEQKGDHTYVYCAVLYEEYVLDTSGNLKDAGGSHIPTIITVKERAGGGYEMVEYWTPRDGDLYAPDIRERFPLRYQGKALDITAYYAEHHASCLAQARERFGLVPIYSESKYTAYSYAGPPNAHFYLDPEGDACQLMASPLSSALGVGTYFTRGEFLFLTYGDGIFTFRRDGKSYVFDAEASTADMSLLTFGGETVPDGAVFHPVIDRRTEYFEPLVTVSGMSHLPEDKRDALYKDVPSGNLPVLALTSPAEVDAFLAEYGEELNFDPEWDAATPRERLEGLDDAFFADYSVLAVYYSAGSCSVTPQIVNLSYYKEQGRESILLAEVDVYEPQSGDAALGQWFMLAKVDKAAVKNADTVQAQVRQTIPEDYYFQAFTQPVRDLSKANPMSRWRLSDADQHQLQQMVDRLKWMDDALLDRNLQYDACFRLGDAVTYYLDMQGEVLYDGSRVAGLTQEDINFFDLRLRLSGSASAVQAHVTGTMMGWNKAEDYLLLKVTQSDQDLGDTVKVYTRFYVGSVPSDGATVTVGYDGWPVEGDPMEVYAITMEMSGYADLEGGPDDDDDGVFTGKVLQVAGDKMLMQCYDKDKFNQVWVYFAYYYPELNPRVGDEYRIMHSDLVANSNPPQVTAENITPLSSTPTVSTTTTKPTSTTSGTTASTTPTTTVPDVIVFNTENVRRVTFYSHYGAVKVRDVPAEDKAEVLNWLGTFRIKERVDDPLHLDGANNYYVEIEYSDGTIIKKGLSAVIVDGELYHVEHGADYYYKQDMIFGKKGTSTSTTTNTTTTTTTTKPTVVNENLPKVSENVGLYRVDMELFQEFLNAPSFNTIKDCEQSPVVNMGAVFSVGEHTVFSVYQSLVDLVNDEEYLTSFLQKNGIREKVVGAVSLTSTGMPFTLWVQTEQRNVFITVELTGKFPREGDPYTFTVLSQEQYAEKYLWREAALIVNNQVVSAGRFAPALVCESRALIPFKTILEACGVNLVYKDFGQGKRYVVGGREFEIGSWDYEDTFRIYEMRGEWGDDPMTIPMISQLRSEDAPNTTIRYVVFDEIIVDNIYLKTLLEYMFKDAQISVEYSRENATIEISVK